MKVTVTAENYEEIVNKLTIDFIIRNGRLQERLEKREWMGNTEYFNTFNSVDIDSMESVQTYVDKDTNKIEKGSTYINFLDQYIKFMELLTLLKNKGKKA